jgi:hypothetical protein
MFLTSLSDHSGDTHRRAWRRLLATRSRLSLQCYLDNDLTLLDYGIPEWHEYEDSTSAASLFVRCVRKGLLQFHPEILRAHIRLEKHPLAEKSALFLSVSVEFQFSQEDKDEMLLHLGSRATDLQWKGT